MTAGDSVVLSLGIDASGASRGAAEFESAIKRVQSSSRGAADSVDDLGKAISSVHTPAVNAAASLTKMQSAVAGFAGGVAAGLVDRLAGALVNVASESIKVADSYQQLDSRLSLVLDGTKSVTEAHERLYQVAQATGQSFEGTANLFQKLGMSSKELGLSYEDLIKLTTTINQALVTGGASASEASNGLNQLAQSFASGTLRGDEFNSVMENFPTLAQAIAKGLGVTTGALRGMAEEGELSASRVVEAIQSQSGQISSDFSKMGTTVEQASTQLSNAWNELSVAANKATGFHDALVTSLKTLTAVVESDELRTGIEALGFVFKSYYGVLGTGINLMKEFADQAKKLAGIQAAVPDIKAAGGGTTPYGPSKPAAHQLIKGWADEANAAKAEETRLQEQAKIARIPKPTARPTSGIGYKMVELEDKKGGGGGGGKSKAARDAESDAREAERMIDSVTTKYMQAHDERVKLILHERDETLAAIEATKLPAIAKEELRTQAVATASEQINEIHTREAEKEAQLQERKEQALSRIEDMYLQSTDQQLELIQKRLNAELEALDKIQASAEEKATARTQLYETANADIVSMAGGKKTDSGAGFGMSGGGKGKADESGQAMDRMREYADQISGVEAMTQMSISAVDQFSGAAASAFTSAITGAQSFEEAIGSLVESMSQMILKMIIAQAIGQALGAIMGAVAGPAAAGPGMTPAYAGAQNNASWAAVGGLRGYAMGGAFPGATGLASGVYTRPTLFQTPETGFRAFAKGGGVGMLAEAGRPEAVMPLSRSPSGELGVSSQGKGGDVIVNVNNMNGSKVTTESHQDQSGNKNLVISIADEVENIVASRIGRSGTKVNRSISGVGGVVAR